MNRVGSESGSAPLSPTVGRRRTPSTVMRVSTTIATSGAGTALVSFGRPKTISRPTAVSG